MSYVIGKRGVEVFDLEKVLLSDILPSSKAIALNRHNLVTLQDVSCVTEKYLKTLPGIGSGTVLRLKNALKERGASMDEDNISYTTNWGMLPKDFLEYVRWNRTLIKNLRSVRIMDLIKVFREYMSGDDEFGNSLTNVGLLDYIGKATNTELDLTTIDLISRSKDGRVFDSQCMRYKMGALALDISIDFYSIQLNGKMYAKKLFIETSRLLLKKVGKVDLKNLSMYCQMVRDDIDVEIVARSYIRLKRWNIDLCDRLLEGYDGFVGCFDLSDCGSLGECLEDIEPDLLELKDFILGWCGRRGIQYGILLPDIDKTVRGVDAKFIPYKSHVDAVRDLLLHFDGKYVLQKKILEKCPRYCEDL